MKYAENKEYKGKKEKPMPTKESFGLSKKDSRRELSYLVEGVWG